MFHVPKNKIQNNFLAMASKDLAFFGLGLDFSEASLVLVLALSSLLVNITDRGALS